MVLISLFDSQDSGVQAKPVQANNSLRIILCPQS